MKTILKLVVASLFAGGVAIAIGWNIGKSVVVAVREHVTADGLMVHLERNQSGPVTYKLGDVIDFTCAPDGSTITLTGYILLGSYTKEDAEEIVKVLATAKLHNEYLKDWYLTAPKLAPDQTGTWQAHLDACDQADVEMATLLAKWRKRLEELKRD